MDKNTGGRPGPRAQGENSNRSSTSRQRATAQIESCSLGPGLYSDLVYYEYVH